MNSENPKFVQISVEITKIGEIDNMNEKFSAEFKIVSRWVVSCEMEDPKLDWNPCLFIENAIQEPKELVKYMYNIENELIYLTEIKQIKGIFWERLELQNFPVDVQELSIFITTKLSQKEVVLVPDSSNLSCMNFEATKTFVDQQKWKLFKLVKVKNSALCNSDSINSLNENPDLREMITKKKSLRPPQLIVTCYAARKPTYYLYNAYLLIFLITVSSLTIFSIDCKFPQNRLQTTYTLLLTSISFKWVINRSLPTVSYLTSLDKYAIACIAYLCMLCVWHALVGAFWEKDFAKKLDFYFLIVFCILLLLVHVWFILWLIYATREIRSLKRKEKEFLYYYKNNNDKSKSSTNA